MLIYIGFISLEFIIVKWPHWFDLMSQKLTPSYNRQSCRLSGQRCWRSPPLGRSSSSYLSSSLWKYNFTEKKFVICIYLIYIDWAAHLNFKTQRRICCENFFSLIFMSLGWAAGRILLSYLEIIKSYLLGLNTLSLCNFYFCFDMLRLVLLAMVHNKQIFQPTF